MVIFLASQHPVLAECLRVGGPNVDPFRRPDGFAGLLRIILEQQLSTRVAEVLWTRLVERLDGVVEPQRFLASRVEDLKICGFSRQKIAYGRGLAEAVVDGRIDFPSLCAMDDDAAVTTLVALKGVGRWTAEIYLLAALGRPDVWPADDLAIRLAMQRLHDWPERPGRPQLQAAAEPWRPYRSDAARLMWHYYLAMQSRSRTGV